MANLLIMRPGVDEENSQLEKLRSEAQAFDDAVPVSKACTESAHPLLPTPSHPRRCHHFCFELCKPPRAAASKGTPQARIFPTSSDDLADHHGAMRTPPQKKKNRLIEFMRKTPEAFLPKQVDADNMLPRAEANPWTVSKFQGCCML